MILFLFINPFEKPQPSPKEAALRFAKWLSESGIPHHIVLDSNFIGVDIKGSRLWAGAKIADADNLVNAAFLRIQMHQLDEFFAPDEVDEIWIIHPDPRPKKRDIRRRLTNDRYLDQFKNILKPRAELHLKTDNTPFFEYTLEVLRNRSDVVDLVSTYDLDNSTFLPDHMGIKTRYELMFREEGEKIKYLKFRFK